VGVAGDTAGGYDGSSGNRLGSASKSSCPNGRAAAGRPLDLRGTGRDSRDDHRDPGERRHRSDVDRNQRAYKNVGNNNVGFNVYDRLWNLVEDRPWRYSPHDGSGIQSPLTVGETWPVQTNNINSANGNIWKRSGTSKVVGQESVTTKAGTFDTFKIDTTFTARNVNNPTLKNEVTSLTWYAPAVDHWVKRTFVSRTDKHLVINNTIELVEYGRKQ
jgi:hypothetical protein